MSQRFAVRHAELAQDGGDVAAHGGARDEEAVGDLPRREALPEQVEDLPLATRQAVVVLADEGPAPRAVVAELVHEARDEGRRDRRLAAEHPFERLAEAVGPDPLR